MKTLLILLLLIPYSLFAQAWDIDVGDANIDEIDSFIVIESNKTGQFVIIPKMHLSTTIQLEKSKLIFAWGSAKYPIREMKFSDPSDALKILEQIYPKYYCLSHTGLKKCKMGNILGVKK